MVNKTYKVNDKKVISETIDGETIIINLETGNYYSTNKTMAIIWNQIEGGNGTLKILQYFLNHYEVDEKIAEKSVTEMIDYLLKNDLILKSDLELESSGKKIEKQNDISKAIFEEPNIEKYDDMKQMLVADPIHDVNEDGWPNLK